MQHILGIDIGGTGIKSALVDLEAGKLVSRRHRVLTPESRQPADVLAATAEAVHHFHQYQGPIGVGFPAVIVGGCPKTPFSAYQVTSWLDYPVADKLAEMTGCPVTVLNDADAAGLAEMRFGAGRGVRGLVILLTLGTGIGSGVFYEGVLVPNTEFGHMYLKNRPNVAEFYASERARIERKLKWREWAVELDAYLLHLVRIFTPDLFIIGGGVSQDFEKFVRYLTVNTPLVPATLGNHAGIIGAALAAPLPPPT